MLPDITDKKLLDKVSESISLTFPEATILSVEEVTSGLNSKIYKAHLSSHPFIVIARQSGLKNFEKSIQILNYLKECKLPVPKIFYHDIWEDTGLSLLEFIPGETALEYLRNTDNEGKKAIFRSIGSSLSQLHALPIQPFWFRKTYPIQTSEDWDLWLKERLDKVEVYSHANLSQDIYDYTSSILSNFKQQLKASSHLPIVAMHGDFHLENVHVDASGHITGILDFDTAMRGKSYGDTGRFLYSLLLHDTHYIYDPQEFDAFLEGYNILKTTENLLLIHGYFLLMLLEKHEIFAKEQNEKRFISHNRVLESLAHGELKL
ncbi:MAG: aminoglycoside phosphotransferase family protein [Candidatus Gracilibacteria bacterium]